MMPWFENLVAFDWFGVLALADRHGIKFSVELLLSAN